MKYTHMIKKICNDNFVNKIKKFKYKNFNIE
jgi:hypothetical protein